MWIGLLQSIIALLGIYTALYGIDSWRREHTGKRKIELAEDSLALFYEAQDAIKYMRHETSWGNETENIEKGEKETQKQFEARKNASVVFKRYNDHQETFNKLHSMRYRYMAQIGKVEAEPFDELREIVNEIMLSARRLARLWAQDNFGTEDAENKHFERIKKAEAIFWEGEEDDDPINPRLERVISNIENTSKKVIEGKGTLYGILNYKFWERS
ncbi:hypothetical protein KA005_30400 [bacterium]|nr:hypothetical protein [bacterium]